LSNGRRIILHIGLHKTGTTTIQHVLHANRDFLLRQEGVLYPSLDPNLSIALGTIFRNDPWPRWAKRTASLTTEELAARREEFLNSLDAEISSSEWNTLLLSAEGVSNLSAPEFAKLREWGEKYSSRWTILVCVRHPLDWSRSAVQQRLKQGNTLHQLYEDLPTPNYRLRISRAISVFGRENVRVFDFESAVKGDGGIVGSFADQAELSAPSRDLLASRALRRYNESLSLEAARILDSLNRQRPMFVDDGMAPHRSGPGREVAYFRRIEGRKFDVPEWVKEDIRSRNREDVLWLNETFGLDLYHDVTELAPQAQSHEEPAEALGDPAIDSIAVILGELIAANVLHRLLDQGRAAIARGNLERAERVLREAARLDPDAPQPKKLLKKVRAKQPANTGEPSSQEGTDKRGLRASFLSRLRL
jgi:hypothetical protein